MDYVCRTTLTHGVFPDINYFIEPEDAVKCLTTFNIIEGKFCLLHGHRQSGKTTIIQAIARHLREISDRVNINGFPTGLEVYIISFNAGIDVENGVDSFWGSLKMQAVYPHRFPLGEKPVSSSTFQSLFRWGPESQPVVLLFDEGSFLVNRDNLVVDDFIGMLRLLRDGRDKYCMQSLVLAGVETVKQLLAPWQSSGFIGRISPFTREATIASGHFTEPIVKYCLNRNNMCSR